MAVSGKERTQKTNKRKGVAGFSVSDALNQDSEDNCIYRTFENAL